MTNQFTSPSAKDLLPGWIPLANRFVMWLQRRGVKTGTIHVLTVPGRTSGRPRSTPVSILSVADHRYIVAGLEDADWVQNARSAGRGILAYGRRGENVRLVELEETERAPILRSFPIEVPHGTQFFEKVHEIEPTPDGFAQLADRCPVFRVEPVNSGL